MTKRRLLMIGLAAGCLIWLAAGIDAAAMALRFEPIALPVAIGLGIAGTVALAAGIIALVAAKRRTERAAMANDDALRVIRMQQRKAMAENAQPVTVAPPPLAPAEPTPVKKIADAAIAAAPVLTSVPRKALSLDGTVFFQPVVHVPSGNLGGFCVLRRLSSGLSSSNAKTSFVRHASHLSRDAQAKFEVDSIEKATSEARRVLGRDFASQALWIDVAISEALLSDRVRLQAVLNLMSAHPTLKRGIRLMVDGRALFKARKAVLDAVKAIQREGVSMSLNLSEEGRQPIDRDMVSWFDAVYVSKSDVQQAVMRAQADAAVAANHQRALPQATSLLAALAAARQLKIPVIATNLVCEPDVVDMLAEEIDTMTGPMFGEPRAVKTSLLNQPARDSNRHLNRAG